MKVSSNSLWRQKAFLKLWTGQTVSQFGVQVTLLAIPLTAAFILNATPFQMGLLGALEYLPYLLFGLFVGVWVDRYKRLPILIASNILRAILLVLIPISVMLDHLSIVLLLIVAFFVGICTVFFDVAYQSYLPTLVQHNQIMEGNSKLETSRSAAQIVGPGVSGVLAQLFTAPFAIFITSATFFISAIFLGRIRTQETKVISLELKQDNIWSSMAAGINYVIKEPKIFALSRCAIIWNLSWNIVFTVFVLYATRDIGVTPSILGIIFAASGVGVLLGAIVANKVTGRLGMGPTLIWSGMLAACGGPFFPMIHDSMMWAVIFMIIGQFILGFGSCIFGIAFVSLRQSIVPDHYLGRVAGVTRFAICGAFSIGSLAGGYLGKTVGLRETLVIGAIGLFTGVITLFFSPLLKYRTYDNAAENAASQN